MESKGRQQPSASSKWNVVTAGKLKELYRTCAGSTSIRLRSRWDNINKDFRERGFEDEGWMEPTLYPNQF
jgi:hypothetical protein